MDQARCLLSRMSWDRARLTALEQGLKGAGAWDSPSLNPTGFLGSLSCLISVLLYKHLSVSIWWSMSPTLLLPKIWGETKDFFLSQKCECLLQEKLKGDHLDFLPWGWQLWDHSKSLSTVPSAPAAAPHSFQICQGCWILPVLLHS